jgi:L,D-transpeptidase YcbB
VPVPRLTRVPRRLLPRAPVRRWRAPDRTNAAIVARLYLAGALLLAPAAAAAAAPPLDPAPARVVPAALQAPPPATDGQANAGADSEIKSRIENANKLVVAGEKLHVDLLQQFYAAHNWQTVWPSHGDAAAALRGAVLAAGEQGLDPDLFHGDLLRNLAPLSPLDRELVQSDAFLAYADALARGALPIEDRIDDEDLSPGPVDTVRAVDKAIASRDPAAAIAALAPDGPAYKALRRALARYRAAPQDSKTAAKLAAIEINLERLRWLPRQLPPDRAWVNAASARLVLYRADTPVFTTRVIVGEADNQTPEFITTIDSVLFNPPWNIPPSIAAKEILPKLEMDPDYLAEHHMIWRSSGGLQQIAGPYSALGRLKFEMNDRFDVYLHDTPERYLFARDNRRRSHGCVRVQNPRDLAALLLGVPVTEINEGVAQGVTHRRTLPTPMPVFVVYQTAVAGADGTIDFFPDVYDRDAEIWQRLHPGQAAPMAAGEPTNQRHS